MKIKFYTRNLGGPLAMVKRYPAFVLVQTDWDDFGYVSNFILTYRENQRSKKEIGHIKIIERLNKAKTVLPRAFVKLPTKYCSLGQSNSFYENLRDLFSTNETFEILSALNDITYSKGLLVRFELTEGFSKSLLRFSEAQKAFNEAQRIVLDIKTKNCFKFSFTTQVAGFLQPHIVKFKFDRASKLPKRISAFIGKNGSGKTQVLARLASTLSGSLIRGSFDTEFPPPFSRVLAISYNLFDKFEKPKRSKSFSYYYCGIQTDSKLLTEKQIERRIFRALQLVHKSKNNIKLGNYLTELLGNDVAVRVLGEEFSDNPKSFTALDKSGNTMFSSGQIILILVLTEILAYARKESLLLFDEPETHLHPNAISRLIGVICKILDTLDCYAIIATHSPQIIQEIPSSEIFLFSNTKDVSPVKKIPIESFGENLTTLTEQIFQTVNIDENYKTVLEDLSKKYSAKQILKLFETGGKGLSLNARIFLEGLYK